MNPLERLLLLLSHEEAAASSSDDGFDRQLIEQQITDDFPGLLNALEGRRIVDFGCGLGHQAVVLAHHGAEVLALDIDPAFLAQGRRLAALEGVEDRIRFAAAPLDADLGTYDGVLSINSMEHFSEPESILGSMVSLLRPGGQLLVSFNPTWYSPWGAHMHFFTKVPWVHLIFPESTVMAVRARYRDDGASRYEDVRGGLNRMSVAKYERLLESIGVETTRLQMIGVRGIGAFSRIPLLRELLVPKIVSESQRTEKSGIPLRAAGEPRALSAEG